MTAQIARSNSGIPDAPTGRASVLVVDDVSWVGEGLCDMLSGQPGLHIVGTTCSLEVAVAAVKQGGIDVALLDYPAYGQSLDAIAITHQLARFVAVALLVVHQPDEMLLAAVDAGCRGLLQLKVGAGREIGKHAAASLRALASGQKSISPEMEDRLTRAWFRSGRPSTVHLTPREWDVLLAANEDWGRTDQAIATLLGISVNTIRMHMSALRTKLNAQSKTGVLWTALQDGLVQGRPRSDPPDAQKWPVRTTGER